MFVQSLIRIFDSFDALLQDEEPLIHILYHSTLRLYRSLLLKFALPEVISESYDMLTIDLADPHILQHFNSIFIRAVTEQYPRDIIRTSENKKFLKEVRAFFIKCANYLQTSASKNDVIRSLTLIHLPERHQAMLDELGVLRQRFPRVIADMNALKSEFLEY